MTDPKPTPKRAWYALDLPSVLVCCLFVLVVEGIAAITYYRQQVAMIPALGRATITIPQPQPVAEDAPCTRGPEVEMDSR